MNRNEGAGWDAGTFEGSRRAQIERNLQLTVRERLQGLEDLTETSDRLAGLAADVDAPPVVAAAGQYAVLLDGTAPTPLASYLKALGVLRLVSEQVDSEARGSWRDGRFVLISALDRTRLEHFVLDEYAPTPLLAPWGARSGFYPGSSEASARAALDRIAASDNARLRRFRAGIGHVRSLLARHGIDEKPTAREAKLRLLRACRAELPDDVLPWLDACYVLTEDGRSFPPLLGTGGNEGSASYVANYAQAVIACVQDREFDPAVPAALFGVAVPWTAAKQTAVQFSPGAVGGPNAGVGFSAGGTLNPWDLILCLEGALLFAVTATRRLEGRGAPVMSAPFTVRPTGSGSGALASSDEAEARAEMWMPLWPQPAGLAELVAVLGEGRAQFGRGQARQARDGLDFARAVATLGVERGIAEFQRYSIVKRSGRNNLAVPVDRIVVERRVPAELIDELDAGEWLGRFRSLGRAKTSPGRLKASARRLDDALFALVRSRSADPASIQMVLRALAGAQFWLASNAEARKACPPVPPLSRRWVRQADDASAAFRIAAGIAALDTEAEGAPRVRAAPLPMRIHFAPVSASGRKWEERTHRVTWGGGSLHKNLAALLRRRLLDGKALGLDDKPLASAAAAPLAAVAAWLRGEVRASDVASLVPALALCRIPRLDGVAGPVAPVPLAFVLLKPAFTTDAQLRRIGWIDEDRSLPLRAQLIRLLERGDVDGAVAISHRRLRIAGANPGMQLPRTAVRADLLIPALMTPLSDRDLRSAARSIMVNRA